jgi:hypothetical protein
MPRSNTLAQAGTRRPVGEHQARVATTDYESRLATWREWQPVAAAAQGDARERGERTSG